MKKQLGLLTLGMALCLAAPVAVHAQTATVEIKDDPTAKVEIISAPNITFENILNTKSVTTGKATETLTVANGKSTGHWQIAAKAEPFAHMQDDKARTLVSSDFTLNKGSVTAEGYGDVPAIYDGSDLHEKTIIMDNENKTGNLGTFIQKFGDASITIPSGQAAGQYQANLTWEVENGPGSEETSK